MKAGDFNAIIPPLDSVRMKDFLDRVLQLPYKSNSQDNPEHEEQVKDLLDEFGIFYEYQPNGSQSFPDFRCETKWGTLNICLLYTSPSPRDRQKSRMPSSA